MTTGNIIINGTQNVPVELPAGTPEVQGRRARALDSAGAIKGVTNLDAAGGGAITGLPLGTYTLQIYGYDVGGTPIGTPYTQTVVVAAPAPVQRMLPASATVTVTVS